MMLPVCGITVSLAYASILHLSRGRGTARTVTTRRANTEGTAQGSLRWDEKGSEEEVAHQGSQHTQLEGTTGMSSQSSGARQAGRLSVSQSLPVLSWMMMPNGYLLVDCNAFLLLLRAAQGGAWAIPSYDRPESSLDARAVLYVNLAAVCIMQARLTHPPTLPLPHAHTRLQEE